jgi:lipoyl(octanoyl) transferase
MKSAPAPLPLEVYLLGEVDFPTLQTLQRRLVYDLGDADGMALVLCEHPPTITVGRSGSRAHIVPDDEWLRHHHLRTHWVNRGGGCVLHLPGQLAVYLIVSLEPLRLDVGGHLQRLTDVVLRVLAEFDLKGATRPEVPGVFLGRSRVASLGIAVNRWIAYYGCTLNVGPYLAPFGMIAEPGLGTIKLHQTSMEARRQRPAPMSKVREAIIRHVEAVYGCDRHHLYTNHPLIRKKASPHVYVQSLG